MEETLLDFYCKVNEKYEIYRPKLFESERLLSSMNDVSEKVAILKDLYTFVKEISKEFYFEKRQEFMCFKLIAELLSYCENTFEKEYIINTTTNFNIKSNINLTNEDICVEKIVNLTRKALLDVLTMHGRYSHSFDFYDLENYCETACDKTLSICKEQSIDCLKIKMLHGFNHNLDLFNGRGFHCFNVIILNDQKYLVDCTYKQFFLLKHGLLERIGIPYLGNCYAGRFMLMDERRRKVAEKLLKDGYILLIDEVFKDYMDGFLLSWRNGLYYEETNDFSYETSYTAREYWNFLNNQDDLLKYEKKRTLGFQNQPLKNPYLNFEKR